MKKNLILIGAGGHAKSCIEIINTNKNFKIVGFIDKFKKKNVFQNYPIIGTDKFLDSLKNIKYAFITIGQIKESKIRKKTI